MSRLLAAPALFVSLASLLVAGGCAPPCERYCDVTAAYIERCLTDGTQADWSAVSTAGFANWGVADATEFAASCKTDFDTQLAGVPDSGVLTQACEDEANEFELLEERAQCAELP